MNLVDFLWTLVVVFFMVIYFMMIFTIIGDVFRNRESSGWVKAAWIVAILILPLLSMLVYVIVNGGKMAERSARQQAALREQADSYIREVAGAPDSAAQIAKAHELLAAGAINQAEFDRLKAKALA